MFSHTFVAMCAACLFVLSAFSVSVFGLSCLVCRVNLNVVAFLSNEYANGYLVKQFENYIFILSELIFKSPSHKVGIYELFFVINIKGRNSFISSSTRASNL